MPPSSIENLGLEENIIDSLEMHDTRIIDMIHLYDPKTATTKIARALVDSGATHEAMSQK